jgi:ribosomal protein S18 acetylase RimI-like enzyme
MPTYRGNAHVSLRPGPPVTRLSTVTWGPDRFRVGPWHAEDGVAYVAVPPQVRPPSASGIRELIRHLTESGYRTVLTAALREQDLGSFLDAGFRERERLEVLGHDLRSIPIPSSRFQLRRPRPGERSSVLAIDTTAFEHGWRLDRDGLAEAIAATARTRFRVALAQGPIGYAICGRAEDIGYLQRLAVAPSAQRSGIATALVSDALDWLLRRGARRCLVNTQRSNVAALSLYERCGFVREPSQLVVLERAL